MARSRSALLTLAAIAALAGCCACAPQGSVQGGVQGGAQVPPGVPHSTAPPAGVGGIRRKRRGVHSASTIDRVPDGGVRVLAIGQLLVAGAGGSSGGRLTRGGGRVHARVAPAVRGAGPRHRGLAVAGAAGGGARARLAVRRAPPGSRRWPVSRAALRAAAPAATQTPGFLTGVAALVPHPRTD